MKANGPERYGQFYWCVKTTVSDDGEIYLHASSSRHPAA
jgi:hypothetical protein